MNDSALDLRHIDEICKHVLESTPHMGQPNAHACACRVDSDGVTALLPSPDMRLNATRALRQHGYDTADPPGDDPQALSSVRVTGWSPNLLDRRVRDLRLAVDQLERTFPTTIANAVGAFLGLRGRHSSGNVKAAPVVTAHAELRNQVEQATGPVVTKLPRADQASDAIRAQLDEVGDLSKHITRLLDLHKDFARVAIDRMETSLHTRTFGSAQDRVIAEACADAEHRLHTDRSREAWRWADEHLPAVNAVPFAKRYVAAYGPYRLGSPTFSEAAARWRLAQRDDASGPSASASTSTPEHDIAAVDAVSSSETPDPPEHGAAAQAATDFPTSPVADAPPEGQASSVPAEPADGAHRSPGGRR